MTFGLFQPLNALIRPHKGTKFRFAWEVLHKNLGAATIFLAIPTILLGLQRVKELYSTGNKYFILYIVTFGALAMVSSLW